MERCVFKMYQKGARRTRCSWPFSVLRFLRKCCWWVLESNNLVFLQNRRLIKRVFRKILYKIWFLNALFLFVQALPQEVYRELSTGKTLLPWHSCHLFYDITVNIHNNHLHHIMGRQKNHLMYLKGIVVTLGEEKKINIRIM